MMKGTAHKNVPVKMTYYMCAYNMYNMYMCMQIDTTHYCELIMILAAVHSSCCTFGQYMTVSCGTVMLHCHVGQCRPVHFKFMAFSPHLQRERERIHRIVCVPTKLIKPLFTQPVYIPHSNMSGHCQVACVSQGNSCLSSSHRQMRVLVCS